MNVKSTRFVHEQPRESRGIQADKKDLTANFYKKWHTYLFTSVSVEGSWTHKRLDDKLSDSKSNTATKISLYDGLFYYYVILFSCLRCFFMFFICVLFVFFFFDYLYVFALILLRRALGCLLQ